MRNFLINLAIAYLNKHGYVSRNLIADYVNTCRTFNDGARAGARGDTYTSYSKIASKELESYRRRMSRAEMIKHITDYEAEILPINFIPWSKK